MGKVIITLLVGGQVVTQTQRLQPGDTVTIVQNGTPETFVIPTLEPVTDTPTATNTATHTPTPTRTATSTPTPQVFRASGRVALADGSPLAGVTFNTHYATTGADGRWEYIADHGGSWTFVPQLAGYVFQPPLITVTPVSWRMRRVLRLASDGLECYRIAERLHCQPSTVMLKISGAMERLGAMTQQEAITICLRNHWI